MELNKTKVIQSHGMTHAQMEELHVQQAQGEKPEMVPANNASDIRDKFFAAEYTDHQIPVHEQHIFHVVTDARMFNVATGEKTSQMVVHKFTKQAFEFQKKHGAFNGQIVHILHNPDLKKDEGKDEQEQVDLSKLTKAKLEEHYHSLTGEDVPTGSTKADIIALIEAL